MPYLQRINYRPTTEGLNEKDQHYLAAHFDAYGAEVVINQKNPLPWEHIEEVEVAQAARSVGPSGWLVKRLVMGGERYHVALYSGREEAVLTNVTLPVVKYVVQTIAYYASTPIRYTGPEDITPLTTG